ncbi:MAG: hypothetical protein JW729_01465 [Bacteroidales bacterium]|nr:hypothetical protein [Bacteroidales bacterium]
MKIDMIILGLASLWALYWNFRNQHIFSGIISLGLIASIIIAFLKPNNSINLGVSLFLIFGFAAVFYALFYKKINSTKRIIMSLVILPTLLYWIFLLNHLSGAAWLWYGLFLPFIAIILGILKPVNLKNEWGIIILFLAEAFTHIYPVLLKL